MKNKMWNWTPELFNGGSRSNWHEGLFGKND